MPSRYSYIFYAQLGMYSSTLLLIYYGIVAGLEEELMVLMNSHLDIPTVLTAR
jgi:hypothetical protein